MPSTTDVSPRDRLTGALVKTNDWLRTRFNNIDIFDEKFQLEAKTNPFYSLGGIFYLIWFLVMATGLVLMIWYIPTKAAAFDSILNIQHHIPFGNIFRGVHKYGADAMIIAATMRMFRMFIAADYKPGREFNIAIGLVTLLLSMYSGLTGYLLIWNQRAFWATKVFATFPTYMDQFPVMGDFYLPLIKSVHMGWNTAEFLLGAGGAITQETITRFFSLHLAFSLIPLIFVELYFYKTGYKRVPISWIKRSVVILMLVVVAIIMPAALGHRSNPDVTPLPILSDWYFLGLYQMYKYLEPVVATEITMLIPLTVVAIPFIDVWVTGPEKNIWKRPLVFYTTIMGFVNWIVFSILIIANIANIHNDPPWWRDFLYMMVNVGMVLQIIVYLREKETMTRIKFAKGAMWMAILAFLQTITAFVFYFMARTEMFLSPLTQAWTYMLTRPFMGEWADKSEALIRETVNLKANPSYWFYHDILAKGGEVPAKEQLLQIREIAQQKTLLDPLFQIIPTFQMNTPWMAEQMKVRNITAPFDAVMADPTKYGFDIVPSLHYNGLIDYMISNRWTFDYVTFMDRMGGVTKPYPIEVPPLDWGWMLAGPACMVLCLWAWWKFRNEAKVKAAETKPVATPSAT